MGGLNTGRFFSGTSGLILPVPKYLFPTGSENSSRLTYYSSLLNSIEINSSFYKIPRRQTINKWVNQTAEQFKFTFKLWKGITHNRSLTFTNQDIASFLHAIEPASDKKGCLLIQFPPALDGKFICHLAELLKSIKKYDFLKWKVAVEFRNKSWYNDKTYQVLNDYHVALVIQDIPKSITPMINHESSFIYLRFHGPTGNYKDSYTKDFLSEYSLYISEWLKQGKDVYTYFNNTAGDAWNNLQTLRKEVAGK